MVWPKYNHWKNRIGSRPADHFTATIFEKYQDADEIRLIFDRFVTTADIYLVAFLFILVIVTYINELVLLLLGMMYHFL